MVAQLCQHGVGNGADTHLQRSAVLDERRAVLADGRLNLVGLGEVCLHERRVVLNEEVDFRDVNHRVTEGAGNVLVHDGNDVLGRLDGSQRGVDRRAQRYVAVLVGAET